MILRSPHPITCAVPGLLHAGTPVTWRGGSYVVSERMEHVERPGPIWLACGGTVQAVAPSEVQLDWTSAYACAQAQTWISARSPDWINLLPPPFGLCPGHDGLDPWAVSAILLSVSMERMLRGLSPIRRVYASARTQLAPSASNEAPVWRLVLGTPWYDSGERLHEPADVLARIGAVLVPGGVLIGDEA